MSRRTLLSGAAAAAAAGVAGCASDGGSPHARSASSGFPTPTVSAITSATDADRRIALGALHDEQTLRAVYGQLARRNPRARGQIAALIALQTRHVDALVEALALDEAPATPQLHLVVSDLDAEISAAAGHAAQGRLADCRRVESGGLASMLASMAAAHRVVASQWAAA